MYIFTRLLKAIMYVVFYPIGFAIGFVKGVKIGYRNSMEGRKNEKAIDK